MTCKPLFPHSALSRLSPSPAACVCCPGPVGLHTTFKNLYFYDILLFIMRTDFVLGYLILPFLLVLSVFGAPASIGASSENTLRRRTTPVFPDQPPSCPICAKVSAANILSKGDQRNARTPSFNNSGLYLGSHFP